MKHAATKSPCGRRKPACSTGLRAADCPNGAVTSISTCCFRSGCGRALRRVPSDALFVFCDQALGPWVPLVSDRPHVVHVHDLLALRSALGDVPENRTALPGRIYQRYIRRGFRQARHFICISRKTSEDLRRFGGIFGSDVDVVYNGLNHPYAPMTPQESQSSIAGGGVAGTGGRHGAACRRGPVVQKSTGSHPAICGLRCPVCGPNAAPLCTVPLPLWCISPEPKAAIRRALTRGSGAGAGGFLQ